MKLYHGGAPGFRPGGLITPHEAKRVDGCPWCESGADDSHRPDRVFATTMRLYGRYYASKWIRGTLYIVRPNDDMEPSAEDPFETYCAPSFTVVSVCEREIELTMGQRRRLLRLWKEADLAHGLDIGPMADMALERMFSGRTLT